MSQFVRREAILHTSRCAYRAVALIDDNSLVDAAKAIAVNPRPLEVPQEFARAHQHQRQKGQRRA